MNVLRTLIVPAIHAPLARELCKTLAGPSGDNMFVRELSPTGTAPATHYASSGLIEDQFAALMAAGAEAVFGQAQLAGIATTLEAITALLQSSDISEEEPFSVLGRLGLKTIEVAA